MFDLAYHYGKNGMAAYSKLQEREFKLEKERGFRAIKHQSFVGAGYFDEVNKIIMGGSTSVNALEGSTEEEQFPRNGKDNTEVKIHNLDNRPNANELPQPNLKQRKFKAG